MNWEAGYSRVSGELPVDDFAKFQPHAGLDHTSFVRFEFDVSTAGKIKLAFGDITGLSLWIDGKPTTLTADHEMEASAGRHIITLAVNRVKRTSPLRVELVDVPNSPAQVQLVGGK